MGQIKSIRQPLALFFSLTAAAYADEAQLQQTGSASLGGRSLRAGAQSPAGSVYRPRNPQASPPISVLAAMALDPMPPASPIGRSTPKASSASSPVEICIMAMPGSNAIRVVMTVCLPAPARPDTSARAVIGSVPSGNRLRPVSTRKRMPSRSATPGNLLQHECADNNADRQAGDWAVGVAYAGHRESLDAGDSIGLTGPAGTPGPWRG